MEELYNPMSDRDPVLFMDERAQNCKYAANSFS